MQPKVRYRVHKSPLLVPILSQLHLVYTSPPQFPRRSINRDRIFCVQEGHKECT